MNERQRRFADEYIISGNVYQSAIKAGYSENYAKTHSHKILENVSVKSYISEKMSEIESSKVATMSEVMEVWTSILRGERSEEVVMMDPTTGDIKRIEKKADNATVIRAGAELAKRYPLPVELSISGTVVFANESDIPD